MFAAVAKVIQVAHCVRGVQIDAQQKHETLDGGNQDPWVAIFFRPHRNPPPETEEVLEEQIGREVKASSVAFGDSVRRRRLSKVFRRRPGMRSGV